MKKEYRFKTSDSKTTRKSICVENLHMAFILVINLIVLLSLSLSVQTVHAHNDPNPQANQSSDDILEEPIEQPNDAYYSDLFAYSWQIPEEEANTSTFWIEVDLTQQMLYAYRGDRIINTFLVSTGAGKTPTVTGTYRIYVKYDAYYMTGPNYEYPDVPYTMFFHKGYSIHGTYWHNNFGTPMSYGCVNMETEDAAWIYKHAPVGTYIFIHY